MQRSAVLARWNEGGRRAGLCGSESRLEFLVYNPNEATRAWRRTDTFFAEVHLALVWLPDTPGTLTTASEALADSGINIESSYIARAEGGRAQVAFGCADAQ